MSESGAEQGEPNLDELARAISELEIGQFLLSTVSTLASIAYGKLEQHELEQAKTAIDAVAALLKVLDGRTDAGLLRDFGQALANLQVAYAGAASSKPD